VADYENKGNRWTAVFMRKPQQGGGVLYERAAFEIVRFNVDTTPDAPEEIVPVGQQKGYPSGTAASPAKPDGPKLYERIWVVDTMPFRPGAGGKQQFSNIT
jgi:hypothetical protein